MSEADDWAAQVVAAYEGENAEACHLAMAVSLASRVEPALLRRARLELCPWIHAGAESELWYSPLVQYRSPKAMVFAPAIAWQLQQRLRDSGQRPGLAASRELLREAHDGLPAAIRLEEEILWRAVADPKDPEIPGLLYEAVRLLLEAATPDLAEWAARALPHLPPPVRQAPEAWLLALAASSRLGGLAVLGEPMPDGLPANDLLWIAAQSSAQVPVYLRRREGDLLLSLHPDADEAEPPSLPAPHTDPVLLEVSAGDTEPRLIALQAEEPQPLSLPLGGEGLRLRTAAGEVFRVEVPVEDEIGKVIPDLRARSPFQVYGALPPGSPVFVGRLEERREIREGLRRSSFLIVGPRQIGKTSLLNQIRSELAEQKGVRPFFIDCQAVSRSQDLARWMRDFDPDWARSGQAVVEDLFRELTRQALREGEQPVFLVNEIDGLVRGDSKFLEELRGLNDAAEARFVFTGFVTALEAAELPEGVLYGWVRGLPGRPAFSLGPLEPEDARTLLGKLEGPDLGLHWSSPATREAAYARIVESTQALPWLLQQVCAELLSHLAERRTAVLRLEDVAPVLASLPALGPRLEGGIHSLVTSAFPAPAGTAASLLLYALAQDSLVLEGRGLAADPVFNAEEAADAARRAASALGGPTAARLAEYFAGVSIDGLLARVADSTLVLQRRYDSAGRRVGYSFVRGLYPRELLRSLAGLSGLEERLLGTLTELAAALRPDAFTTEPIDPADPELARVSWGPDGRSWRLDGSSGPLTLAPDDLLGGEVLVVAGEARSGLRSFLHWIRWSLANAESPGRFVVLDVRLIPPTENQPLDEVLGEMLIEQLQDSKVPVNSKDLRLSEVLRWYGTTFGREHPLILALLGLDGLPPESLGHALLRLRSFQESSRRPFWGSLILSASWSRTLYPDLAFSPFDVGPTRRLPCFTANEIADLWDRFGPAGARAPDLGSIGADWTGGQPLLVQLFLREAAQASGDLEQAARRLVARPPEAVRLWQRDLASILLDDAEAQRFLRGLLMARRSFSFSPRSATELFNFGWIRPAGEKSWEIRSKVHAEWARAILEDPARFVRGAQA